MGFIVRRLSIGCGLLAAAVAITLLAFPFWKASVNRNLDATWRRELGGLSFLERYPKMADNATVLELEALGAAIGIDMAPPETQGRSRPTPEVAQRFAAIRTPLKELLDPSAQPEDGAIAAPPATLADYLGFARPTLLRVVEVLRRDPPPIWQRDLGLGFDTRVANLLGILQLQRLLLLEARERLRNGHSGGALAVLEASWRYNEALRENSPALIGQLIALAVLKLQQPVLRRLPTSSAATARWRARLDGTAARSWILIGFHAEAFIAHRAAALDQPLGRDQPMLHLRGLTRLLIWDYSRRFETMIQDLPGTDLRSFDPDAFDREQQKRLPRWQVVARLLLPNFWDAWGKAGRGELSTDLTARILEERDRLASGGPPRAANRRPSRVSGLSWIYEETPEGTRIHLDGDLAYREAKPVPLRFLVRHSAR